MSEQNNHLGYDGPASTGGGFFTRLIGLSVAFVTLTVLLVVGLAFSLVVIPIVLFAALVAVGYFWFKTRAFRRELREFMQNDRETMPDMRGDGSDWRRASPGGAKTGPRDGAVIEGDFIKEASAGDTTDSLDSSGQR